MKRAVLAASLATSLGVPVSALALPPPASAFGAVAQIEEVRISPDGKHVAMSTPSNPQGAIMIATVDEPGLKAIRLGDVEISQLQWADDQYLLATVRYKQKVLLGQRKRPVDWTAQRVVAIAQSDGKIASTLLGDDVASANLFSQRVSGIYPGPPVRVWMRGEAGRVGNQLRTPELFSVDPANGVGERVETGAYRTVDWGFDPRGLPRSRLDVGGHGELIALIKTPESQWTPFWTSHTEADRKGYHGYSVSEDAFIISRTMREGTQLVFKHLSDGAETPLGSPHLDDPVRMVWDPHKRTLSARGFGNLAVVYEWYDPDLASVQASLARVFPGKDVYLLDWSRDRTRFVIAIRGVDSPLSWSLYDRMQKTVSPIGEAYPDLKGVSLGATRWVSYKARDGLELHAYLTLPPNVSSLTRHLPLVVLPHDGPDQRDVPNFAYLTQFLATRGYAVLRPQYRGSAGFGDALQKAGDQQWSAGMQTDLLDGVSALAAQGAIDPRRVCVIGKGFGGYAALLAVTAHPSAYACAVSIAGVSNLKVLRARGGTGLRNFRQQLASISYREPIYDAGSPSLHADQVRAPILLVSVAGDVEVPTEQTDLMADALSAVHKPFERLVLTNTDHEIHSSGARTEMLEAIGAFLEKSLAPKVADRASP